MRTIVRSAVVTLMIALVAFIATPAAQTNIIGRIQQGWLIGAASDGTSVFLGADGTPYLKVDRDGNISTVGNGNLRSVKQTFALVTNVSGQGTGTIDWLVAGANAVTSLAFSIINVTSSDPTLREEALHVEYTIDGSAAVSGRKSAGLFQIENIGTQSNSTSARALYLDAEHRSTGTLSELSAFDAFVTTVAGAGSVTEMAGGRLQVSLAGGGGTNVTTLRALRLITSFSTGTAGTATNTYGVYNQVTNSGTSGSMTTAYGHYSLIENLSTTGGTIPTAYNYYAATASLAADTTNAYAYYVADMDSSNGNYGFYNSDTNAPNVSFSASRQQTANGAYDEQTTASTSVSCTSGATCSATNIIPAGSIVEGVTIRVTSAITGATSISIGDGTDVDRWGATIGISANTTTTGANFTITSVPIYTAATSVVITANGSNFTGTGAVRVTVHYKTFTAATS